MFAEAKTEKRQGYMPRAEDKLFLFGLTNKAAGKEQFTRGKHYCTTYNILPRSAEPLLCVRVSVPVVAEKRVSCKPDLDIKPRSYSIPRIRKVLLFPLLLTDKNELHFW